MKLLNCLVCHDIVKIDAEWATCKCEKSCARYAPDNRHAEVFGPCRILGIDNREYAHTIKDPFFRSNWFVIREPNDRIFRHQDRPNTEEASEKQVDDSVIPNRVFVGQLSEDVTEEDIRAVFDKAGEIEEVKVIINRETGLCRGYAFVTYTNAESAEKAIEEFGDESIKGKPIVVKEVRDKNRGNDRPFYNNANKYRANSFNPNNVSYRPKRQRFGYVSDPFNPYNNR